MGRSEAHGQNWPASGGWDDLIRDARDGQDPALAQLLESCRDYLLLIANSELERELHAKLGPSDLVQDTIVQAHERFESFEGHGEPEFRGWMRAILLNRLLAVRRQYREASKRNIAREVSWDDSQAVHDLVASIPADDETPSHRARAKEQQLAIAAAIDTLPADYRQVLVLRYWERLTFADIGERMGRSADAVRKIWLRAVDRLECDGGLDFVAE